jgi:hypothetical protein
LCLRLRIRGRRNINSRSSGLFHFLDSLPDFLGRGTLGRGGCQSLRWTNLGRGTLFIQLLDLLLGHQTLVLEANFAAAFVAVPEDEKQN